MMKEDFLKNIKFQLNAVVDSITLEDLDKSQQTLTTYFDFLKSLKNLPFAQAPELVVEKKIEEKIEQAMPTVTTPPTTVKTKVAPAPIVYTFERKLRGGLIPNLDGGYMVPEKMVRELGLENGDRVVIIDQGRYGDLTRYWFDIAEKGRGIEAAHRVQIEYAIVQKDMTLNRFVVNRTSDGDVRINDVPHTFLLDQKDVYNFNLRDGEIIDIAFYDNNLESVKVIWRHEIAETVETAVSKKKVSKDTRVKAEPEERKYPIDYDLFAGRTVTIMGSESERLKYQTAFDSIGATLIHLTGDEGKVRIRTAIKKSDVIVVTTMYVGHNGSVPAAQLAKEYDVPLMATEKNGIQVILLEAEKGLKRKLEQVTA